MWQHLAEKQMVISDENTWPGKISSDSSKNQNADKSKDKAKDKDKDVANTDDDSNEDDDRSRCTLLYSPSYHIMSFFMHIHAYYLFALRTLQQLG